MPSLSRLLREIHRRSVWQVVSIYVATAWGVIGVVDFFTDAAGLPDWTPTMAFVVMIVGLPVVVATAVIQGGLKARAQPWPVEGELEGGKEGDGGGRRGARNDGGNGGGDGEEPSVASHPPRTTRHGLFTWRNAVLAGVGGVGSVALAAGLYAVSWRTGIGPVQNLAAQGVIDAGDAVLLADFESTSDDPDLARLVTETLRVDLGSSTQIALVEPAQVDNILRRMEAEPGLPLTGDRAEEVAVRGGIKAIVQGTVGDAGSGFILVARVVATADGQTVATARRTASGPDALVDAIDKLSQDIREKAGESLRSIRAEAPLHEVTTSSLDALRLYTEARQLVESGESRRAIERVRQATVEDPEFAMAHRLLAVLLNNEQVEPEEAERAATRAWELRDRLTERERLLAEAYYANRVNADLLGEMEAYETLLERHPDDPTSLNNLALAYQNMGRIGEARDLLARAVEGPGSTVTAWFNLVQLQLRNGAVAEARRTLGEALARYPRPTTVSLFTEFVTYQAAGEWDLARDALERSAADPGLSPAARRMLPLSAAMLDAAEGRVEEARDAARRLLLELRSDSSADPTLVWEAAQALLLVENVFEVPGRYATAREIYREDVLGSPAWGPDVFGAMVAFGEMGLLDEMEGTLGVLREQTRGLPVEVFVGPVAEAVAAVGTMEDDPEGALRTFQQVEGRVGCGDCLPGFRAMALLRADRPGEAADLWAAATDVPDLRFVLVHRLGRRLHEARAREAAGQDERALALYRELAAALPDPDATARAWLAGIEERIEALSR